MNAIIKGRHVLTIFFPSTEFFPIFAGDNTEPGNTGTEKLFILSTDKPDTNKNTSDPKT